MKTTTRWLAAAAVLAALSAAAEEPDKPLGPGDLKRQTLCPVMGGAIDSTMYTEYQGQRIYFCCPGCAGTFLDDPESYFEQAAKDSILFENVQTLCPVMDRPIDREHFLWFMGRGIYFCCPGCVDTFLAEPGTYLEKIR